MATGKHGKERETVKENPKRRGIKEEKVEYATLRTIAPVNWDPETESLATAVVRVYRELKKANAALRDIVNNYETYFEDNDIECLPLRTYIKETYCDICGERLDNGTRHGVRVPGNLVEPDDYTCVPDRTDFNF